MVSKLSSQAFPTAVNIYAAYEHHNKHGRSRSVLPSGQHSNIA